MPYGLVEIPTKSTFIYVDGCTSSAANKKSKLPLKLKKFVILFNPRPNDSGTSSIPVMSTSPNLPMTVERARSQYEYSSIADINSDTIVDT